jgi:hypothetical protein
MTRVVTAGESLSSIESRFLTIVDRVVTRGSFGAVEGPGAFTLGGGEVSGDAAAPGLSGLTNHATAKPRAIPAIATRTVFFIRFFFAVTEWKGIGNTVEANRKSGFVNLYEIDWLDHSLYASFRHDSSPLDSRIPVDQLPPGRGKDVSKNRFV